MPEINLEPQPLATNFTTEQVAKLKELGLWFAPTLRGIQIRKMNDARFQVLGGDDSDSALESQRIQVALSADPDVFLLPGSDGKTLDEQLEIIAEFSRNVATKVPGVEARMLGGADYVDIAAQLYRKQGTLLLPRGKNISTMTQDPASINPNTTLGGMYIRTPKNMPEFLGAAIIHEDLKQKPRFTFAAPVIIPKQIN